MILVENAGKMKPDRHSRIRFALSLLANFGQLSELIGKNVAGAAGKWLTVRKDDTKPDCTNLSVSTTTNAQVFLIEGMRAALRFLILVRTNFSYLKSGGNMIPGEISKQDTIIGARGGAILFPSSNV